MTRFDAIVIGAGVSGSIVGAYLAKGGLKTVVLEATEGIGGPTIGAYTEKGFHCDNHIHEPGWFMASNGARGWWPQAGSETGAIFKWQCMPNAAIYLGTNLVVIPYCANGRTFLDFMSKLAPMPMTEENKNEVARVFDVIASLSEEEKWSKELDTTPVGVWLDKITKDELTKQIFAIYASVIACVAPEEAMNKLSATMIAAASTAFLSGQATCVSIMGDCTNGMLKAFCDVIVQHGGQVLTNHKVNKVIIEDGKAKGVVVSAGGSEKTFEAKRVIVATEYTHIKKLLGTHLPKQIAETIKSYDSVLRISLDVHFGLKREIAKPAYAHILVLSEALQFRALLFVPSYFEPSLAPPGKQLIQSQVYLPVAEYRSRTKEEWIKYLTDVSDEIFPGLKKNIEMIHTHECSPVMNHAFLPIPKVPLECPGISNLYFTGDCTQAPGMAMERAAASAIIVAKKILGG
jgi:phytoene dehydrogenase-like protein